ncbi:hypothetical protein ACFL27_26940 [candidate division CSSED10-310 bacterium]|uniref:Uncharacterized protein n=1 Tax=candidate division CSSED10-310 bacterium TaxID=2855610 RepID=A0ABV6Z5X6_UNCC1
MSTIEFLEVIMDGSEKKVITCPYCGTKCVLSPQSELKTCDHYLGIELKSSMKDGNTIKVIMDPKAEGVFHYFNI